MFLRKPYRYGVATPWREMEKLQREVNRLFSDTFTPSGRMTTTPSYPAINVWSNNDGAVITAELPGIDPEELDISVAGDSLTISGTRQPEELEEGERYHRQERIFGKFIRTFQLPFQVEADAVEAVFEKGILHLSLPRAEVDKPKRIAIKAGA